MLGCSLKFLQDLSCPQDPGRQLRPPHGRHEDAGNVIEFEERLRTESFWPMVLSLSQ